MKEEAGHFLYPKESHDNLLSAAKIAFGDVIQEEEDSYFLQVNTEKHGMIDVIGSLDPVEGGQTVFLRYWKNQKRDVSFVSVVNCVFCDY